MMLPRRQPSGEFKARVALEAIRGERTLQELTAAYGVHPVQIAQWKKMAHSIGCRGNLWSPARCSCSFTMLPPSCLISGRDTMTWGCPVDQAAKQTRTNRTSPIDVQHEATDHQLLGDGQAFREFVCAFLLSRGFQLQHQATCHGSGCLPRHSHDLRVRLGGVIIWRLQCPLGKAVFTVLPHVVLRYRARRPDLARTALFATPGGLSLELSAGICHIAPRARDRLVCARGHQSVVPGLSRCGLPLPASFLADEPPSHGLTEPG